MENPQMVSPWQSYCNNTKCDVFIGPFCTSYCLILPWLHCKRDHFRLQKCRKTEILMLIFEKFSRALPPCWGGATAPLNRAHPPRRFVSPHLAQDLHSLHRRPWGSVPGRFSEILAPGKRYRYPIFSTSIGSQADPGREPAGRLCSFLQSHGYLPITVLWPNYMYLVSKAHVCAQLAQSRYLTA